MRTFLQYIRKLVAALALAALPLASQTGLGVVHGTIHDASGAAVPNAKVSLTNSATGVARTAQANADGIYYFGSVLIGPYRLSVETAGFQTWETDFQVDAGQTVTVDAALTVGNVQTKEDARGATSIITYSYDALNRLIGKTYAAEPRAMAALRYHPCSRQGKIAGLKCRGGEEWNDEENAQPVLVRARGPRRFPLPQLDEESRLAA